MLNLEEIKQIEAVKNAMYNIFGNTLLAIYLHGSAVSGGLRPHSDIDLLVIIECPMSNKQRKKLLTALLRTSGRYPATPGSPKCIEVMVFLRLELFQHNFPVQAEFIYGEWLRDNFEAGELPTTTRDPENTLILAQARKQSIKLLGMESSALLPDISIMEIRQAMYEAIPNLFLGLHGDERNVLLTLARMWYTATTAEFVTKDAAAHWVIPKLPDQYALILDSACRAYLGEIGSEWIIGVVETQQLAEHMQEQIIGLLNAPINIIRKNMVDRNA